MPTGPAARALIDTVAHPLPTNLLPGPGSPNVLIGFAPAWRGIPLAAVTALQTAKAIADTAIKAAESATIAAAGTPSAATVYVAEQVTKSATLASISSTITDGVTSGKIFIIAALPHQPLHTTQM
jgi:hypothetical protein